MKTKEKSDYPINLSIDTGDGILSTNGDKNGLIGYSFHEQGESPSFTYLTIGSFRDVMKAFMKGDIMLGERVQKAP